MIHKKAPTWNGQLKYFTGGLKPVSQQPPLNAFSFALHIGGHFSKLTFYGRINMYSSILEVKTLSNIL